MSKLWTITIRGSKQEVLDALAKAEAPEHVRVHLTALVQSSPRAAVWLCSHGTDCGGMLTANTTLTALY